MLALAAVSRRICAPRGGSVDSVSPFLWYLEPELSPAMAKSAEADKGKPAQPAVVSYFRLYNADSLDCIAIVLGILGALANGPVQPLFAYIFGEVQSCRLRHAVCSQYQYCRLVPARVLR